MAEARSYIAKEDVESLISRERSAISSARSRDSDKHWTGIALSGGGIRSAIFCLGALQALADRDVLKQFDYMSSVSGGGYIATALQWLWQTDATTSASKAQFPYNTARALINGEDLKDKRLAYIRNHGRYLTPGEGITIWSLGAVVVRTLFLNLAIWIPLGALLLCALISVFGLADTSFAAFPNFFSPIQARWKCGDACNTWPIETFFGVCIVIAMVGIAAFAGWAAAFALDTTASPNVLRDRVPTKRRWLYFALQLGLTCLAAAALALSNEHSKLDPFSWSVGIVVVAVLLAFSGVRFLQARGADASENYRWRRKMEVYGGAALPILATILAVGTTPILPYLLANEAGPFAKSVAAAVAAIAGVASAVGGHGAQAQNKPPSDLLRWLLMVACGLFLYVLLCVCYILAQLVISPDILVGSDSNLQNVTRGMILASSGTAIVLGLRSNVNYVGFHRFYRDRLMEAFMPDAKSVEDNVVRPSPDADRLSMASLWPPQRHPDGSARPIPYPIINTNAVFVKDIDRVIASRGGDNFILTPLFVGAQATGWEDTQTHIEKNGPMTLASAMAASGAALNANAAYVGAGVTRDRLLSIVMMLMNLRLGLWIGRPSAVPPGTHTSMPNQFNPGFRYGVTLAGYKSTSSFIELSDGGHFDNLGIYELARRKSAVILVLDGEQDATTSMPALYSVVQRMQEDFKMNVDLEGRLDDLVPVPFPGYPDGAKYVKRPFFVAPLTYEDKTPGVLVYVKLSLASTAGFAAKGYRAQYPDFPHQSTANQFFVAQQVEAYRDVGFANMALALDALGLDKACDPASILKAWTTHVDAQKATTNTAR
ncbi:patatin-like phospholipase family protein [Bradyrhizobium diazoefficiens]